jgi:hypothetical protein
VQEAREACQAAQREADSAKATVHALELEVDAGRQSVRHDTVTQRSALRRLNMDLAEARAAGEELERRLAESQAERAVELVALRDDLQQAQREVEASRCATLICIPLPQGPSHSSHFLRPPKQQLPSNDPSLSTKFHCNCS